MRKTMFLLTLLVGLASAVIGFLLSAPLGHASPIVSDPVVSFAPTIFVLGVILLFTSAVVYELYPDKERRKEQ